MRSWSLKVGRFFGIEVFVHWTFWILILWIFLMQIGSSGGVSAGLRSAAFVLTIFVCVVLHEFGHALTARRFGVVTRDITLYPIGGISNFESLPERPAHELLISIAGPMVNLVIAAILFVYLNSTGQVPDISRFDNGGVVELPFLFSLFVANILLAVFNLIPAFPMDGGRVFRALLSFGTNRATATRIAATVGQLLAIAFVFLGFFYNFWLVFIGLFIFLGAGGEAAFERSKASLEGLRVRDALMHRFTLLHPAQTLAEAADALLNSQETTFVIADGDEPVGLLSSTDIIRGLSESGKEDRVDKYMDRGFFVVSSDMYLPEFFQMVLKENQNVAVVIDNGNFEGLIDRENVEERLMIQQALSRQG